MFRITITMTERERQNLENATKFLLWFLSAITIRVIEEDPARPELGESTDHG